MAVDKDKGTPYSEFTKALRKRAKKKYIGNSLCLRLAEIPHTPLRQSYWNSWHCSEVIEITDGRATSTYCKNRWCLVCQSIRIATLIRKYRAALESLRDPYFVTLTAPNVMGWELKDEIRRFARCWDKIRDAARRRDDFQGLRKCECTARPGGEYHFHYHIIVDGEANARWLLDRWLRLNLGANANAKAQDMRPMDKRSLVELFKYFTKLTAYDKQTHKRQPQDPEALDVIFRAMRKTRVFQSFGGFTAVDEDSWEVEAENTDLAAGVYQWYGHDWYRVGPDGGEGEGISGYQPSESVDEFWHI